MEVKLLQVTTKSADYDFKAENQIAIPFNVFESLVGKSESNISNKPEVLCFKSKDEYLKAVSDVDLGIDKEKPVYIGGAGQIFCFRKGQNEETEVIENGTTDTKKD